MGTGNYGATSNNMKSVHWSLVGGLLHLVQRGGDWAGRPLLGVPKCNSSPIHSQCTNHRIAVVYNGALLFDFNVLIKGLN